jgi:hypothetical protein
MTPPPGTFGATECNLDGAFAPLGNILMGVDLFILAPIALLLVAAGIFALVTAKGPLPHAITKALPRELNSSRDHRLQGLSLMLGGLSALIWTLVIRQLILEPSSPPPPHPNLENAAAIAIALMFLVAGGVVSLAARQRDRRTSEVLNGWQQITKTLRG